MQDRALFVAARRQVAQGIVEIILQDANKELLPPASAGAHVVLHLTSGIDRAYSLTRAVPAPGAEQYELAVALAPGSRGGSTWVHENLHPGSTVGASPPRNLFALVDDRGPVLLVAGGIGITPLLAMARELVAAGRAWRMVYAVRTRARAAYLTELQALADTGGALHLHIDDEAGGRPLDLRTHLADIDAATHVYCCGPQGLMDAVRNQAVASGLPTRQVHFESFGGDAPVAQDGHEFTVELARKGIEVPVRVGQSVLDALEAVDVIVPSVCREGSCGSCECAVIAGEIDHRDQILGPEERAASRTMMVCVSRAKGDRLVLDL